jgi:hypothetical protein
MKPISLLSLMGNGVNLADRILLNKLNEVTERVNELSGQMDVRKPLTSIN